MGCYGHRLSNSIHNRLVSIWTIGCNSVSYHSYDSTWNHKILVITINTVKNEMVYEPLRNISKIYTPSLLFFLLKNFL